MSVKTPHATYRTEYLLTSTKEDMAKTKQKVLEAVETGDFEYLISWQAESMAICREQKAIIDQIEYSRQNALDNGFSQEIGDLDALRKIVKGLFRVVMSGAINNSTSVGSNLVSHAKLEFARRTLDRLGIDGYRIEGKLLDAMIAEIAPNAFN